MHAHGATLPAEPCAYCAEKHAARAAALALECGYARVNRQFIVGELACAEAHAYALPGKGREVWEALREARHAVQSRRVAADAVKWDEILAAVGALADEAAAAEE